MNLQEETLALNTDLSQKCNFGSILEFDDVPADNLTLFLVPFKLEFHVELVENGGLHLLHGDFINLLRPVQHQELILLLLGFNTNLVFDILSLNILVLLPFILILPIVFLELI